MSAEPRLEGGAHLTLADIVTVLAALTDAAIWHEYRAAGMCAECDAPGGPGICDDHGAGLDAAAEYRALAARLGDPPTWAAVLRDAFPEWGITEDGGVCQARLTTGPRDERPVTLVACELAELAQALNDYITGGRQ